jgi:hypothetical protein
MRRVSWLKHYGTAITDIAVGEVYLFVEHVAFVSNQNLHEIISVRSLAAFSDLNIMYGSDGILSMTWLTLLTLSDACC